MSGLEQIEAFGHRTVFERGDGAAAALAGGAVCIAVPVLPDVTMLNRATPVEDEVDVDAIEAFFAEQPVRYAIPVVPGRETLAAELERRGYERGYAWMKFARTTEEPPAAVETDLRVAQAGPDDAEAFELVEQEAYGLEGAPGGFWSAAVGARGLHVFLAWADDQPAAAGVVYVEDGYAWVGGGGTRPSFRRRGGQGALMTARIQCAAELGAHTVVTETGERVEGRASNSYRNILRHGFREQYVRPNWLSPARSL